jgi:NAD(P)-dependent dehydrogenase (short-subunit alcohol dehydrogenase family)
MVSSSGTPDTPASRAIPARTVDLRGSVILVTGASRGLGRALAIGLAEYGADLALTARSDGDLRQTAAEAAKHGTRVETFLADLSRPADIDAMVGRALHAFGRIDGLVNNAGISGDEKPFLETTAEDWDRVLAVDLRGPALLARAVARAMVERRQGRIVNVASIGAVHPLPSLAAYCASKAGLAQLTRVMAVELARHNVRVNAICPGYFGTPMNETFFATPRGQQLINRSIPMRRLGDPDELVATVALLASEASSFMTGSVVVLDGGHTLT